MKFLYIIPARKGSKRIPDKNLAMLHGKPLVQYSIETAIASKLVEKQIIVSTDSAGVMDVALSFPVDVLARPAELATDISPDIGFVRHAVAYAERNGYTPDIIVHLRPTTPIRNVDLVDTIITTLVNSDYDAIRSVEPSPVVPEKCMFVGESGQLEDYFGNHLRDITKATQLCRAALVGNGYVDAFRNLPMEKREDVYDGLRVMPYIFKTGSIVDIDNPADLRKVELGHE